MEGAFDMMSPRTTPGSLFEQIGGEAGVRKLVDEFYARVLADPELRPFFEKTPMERLRAMQYEFFAAALDGPLAYKGKMMSDVHKGRGIDIDHFARFIDKLLETLESYDLSDEMVHTIIGRLNVYVDEITGGTNFAG
jgi:hemoglobin